MYRGVEGFGRPGSIRYKNSLDIRNVNTNHCNRTLVFQTTSSNITNNPLQKRLPLRVKTEE